MGVLQTARLELVPMTRELLLCELESSARLGERLGARVLEGWPPGEYDRAAQEFFLAKFIEEGRCELEWGSYYAIAREHDGSPRTLVAAAGYHGAPDTAGYIEVGYSVVASARGCGYATETVRALVEHAFASPDVKRIGANTYESNPASIAVLVKCGFVRVGPQGGSPSVQMERDKNTATRATMRGP